MSEQDVYKNQNQELAILVNWNETLKCLTYIIPDGFYKDCEFVDNKVRYLIEDVEKDSHNNAIDQAITLAIKTLGKGNALVEKLRELKK